MTKVDFFLGKKELDLDKLKKILKNNIESIPKEITLASIGQYIKYLKEIEKILNQNEIRTKYLNKEHTSLKGQVLGCQKMTPGDYLFLGEGKFHLNAFKSNIINDHLSKRDFKKYLNKTEQKINVYYISANNFKKHEFNLKENIKKVLKKYTLFLNKKEIGLLISNKFGQKNINLFKIKKELKKKFPNKNFYIIIGDNIDNYQLTNFSFLDFYINTACPRLVIDNDKEFDKPFMNYQNLIASYNYFKENEN
ncbi:MAG: diphthamide synthesis protein [Candidatus Woesearchaeota archaeon]